MKTTITTILLFASLSCSVAQNRPKKSDDLKAINACVGAAAIGATFLWLDIINEQKNDYSFESAKFFGPGLILLGTYAAVRTQILYTKKKQVSIQLNPNQFLLSVKFWLRYFPK